MKFCFYSLLLIVVSICLSCSASKNFFPGFAFKSNTQQITDAPQTAEGHLAEQVIFASADSPGILISALPIEPKPAFADTARPKPAKKTTLKNKASAQTTLGGKFGTADRTPQPGGNELRTFGMLSLASGILAFAPLLLNLSLLFSVPFAIAGLVFGKIALGKRKGNYRQRGVALAKAGLLMSGVMAVILLILGAMAIAG